MLIKVVGTAFILLSCGFTGFLLTAGVNEKYKQLEDIILMIEYFMTEINYGYTPVAEMLAELESRKSFSLKEFISVCAESFKAGTPLASAWQNAVFSEKSGLLIDGEDKAHLAVIGDFIGASYKADQLRRLEGAKAVFEQSKNSFLVKKEKLCRLYPSLSVLAGAALAVIIV